MRYKIRLQAHGIYLGVVVVLLAIFIVSITHMLLAKHEQNQQNMESRLPAGDYLPDAENPLIRVIIKTNGFKQIAHQVVELSAEHGLIIETSARQELRPGEILSITPDYELFQNGAIRIKTKADSDRITVHSLNRGYGIPSYRGEIELFSTAEGIVIVNEVPVEEYLYAVVPSEMPASYEPEALKCQAICARSYAYCQMSVYGYPEYYAHVDDSVSYQVYGNSAEQESTTKAVNDTAGKKVWYQGNVVKTYYYSTSCGHSTSIEAWGSELNDSNQYLQGVSICDAEGKAYEETLPWYKWKTTIPCDTLCNLIELNTGQEIGELENIEITEQGIGGVALQLTITGTTKTVTVETENKIRSALGGSGYEITKQDGSVIKSTKLLPSAFFTIAKNGKNYIIEGGGYGHGIGMSQNGANQMAKAGMSHEQILTFFYPGTKVE